MNNLMINNQDTVTISLCTYEKMKESYSKEIKQLDKKIEEINKIISDAEKSGKLARVEKNYFWHHAEDISIRTSSIDELVNEKFNSERIKLNEKIKELEEALNKSNKTKWFGVR